MKRLAIVGILLGALVLTGCFAVPDAPPDPAGSTCRQGVQNALTQLGAKATANSITCGQNTTSGEGGVYDARSGNAAVFYGWQPDPGVAWYQRAATHEEGHAWDFHMNPDHARYAQIRGLAAYDFEDYADVWMMLVGGYSSGQYPTRPPSSLERTQLCGEEVVPC